MAQRTLTELAAVVQGAAAELRQTADQLAEVAGSSSPVSGRHRLIDEADDAPGLADEPSRRRSVGKPSDSA